MYTCKYGFNLCVILYLVLIFTTLLINLGVMEDQIVFYQQVIDTQLLLRKNLQNSQSVAPQLHGITPQLLDVIDQQITLLNQLIAGLKETNK